MAASDGFPLADAYRPFEHQSLPHPVLLDGPGPVERLDEGPARPVASGALTGIDLDDALSIRRPASAAITARSSRRSRRPAGSSCAAATGRPSTRAGIAGRPGRSVARTRSRSGVRREESERDVDAVEESDPTHFRCAASVRSAGGSEHSLPLQLALERSRAGGARWARALTVGLHTLRVLDRKPPPTPPS